MPSDLLSGLFGSSTPAQRAQAHTDAASPQETQVGMGAPALPEGAGAAQAALDEALSRVMPSLSSMQHSLDQIAALLLAAHPKRAVFETLNLDAINGQLINTHGRDFVGIRSSITTPSILFQRTTGQTAAITITGNFQYFAASDGVRVFAAAAANAGNYEFVYTDQIGGAVPQ